MQKWFPPNATISLSAITQNDIASTSEQRPRARLLCFHGAGSDPSMFTSKGTAKRPMPNPLLTYCVDNDIRLLTVHLPGRTSRLNEPMMTSALSIAEAVLNLLEPLLSRPKTPNGNHFELSDEIPLVVAGHSMGTFIAYEFLCLMRQRELPPPKHVLLSCMVAPDTPKDQRPWRPARELDSEGLKAECRLWRINQEVFLPEMWKMYEPILRGDFNLIDDYVFCEPEKGAFKKLTPSSSRSTSPTSSPLSVTSKPAASFHAPLGISTTVFHAENDDRITEDHVKRWKNIIIGCGLFSTSPSGFGTVINSDAEFSIEKIPGGHNFFYEAEARVHWMEVTIQILDKLLIDLEYGF